MFDSYACVCYSVRLYLCFHSYRLICVLIHACICVCVCERASLSVCMPVSSCSADHASYFFISGRLF